MTGLNDLRDALRAYGYAHTPRLATLDCVQAVRDAFALRLRHAEEPLRRQHNARWEPHQHSADGSMVNPLLNPHRLVDYPEVVESCEALVRSAHLLACASAALGGDARLHQTALYESGLGSAPHRDDHPDLADGAMVAVWIALEPIVDEAGPFVLWPGTHALQDPTLDELGRAAWTRRHLGREENRDEAAALAAHLSVVLSGAQPILATMDAGDAVWWDRRTIHGSLAPHVGAMRTRASFIAHFIVDESSPAP